MAARTSVTLIASLASLAASCAWMSQGAHEGDNVYSSAQASLVQRALEDHGYPVEHTGFYDQRTRAAVARFQRSHGIEASGEMDAETARALGLRFGDVTPTREEDWIQDQLQYDAWHKAD